MNWIITYEIPPLRGLYRAVIKDETKELAVEFLKASIDSPSITIKSVHNAEILEYEGRVDV